jgi:hypothetical protein
MAILDRGIPVNSMHLFYEKTHPGSRVLLHIFDLVRMNDSPPVAPVALA